jgi:hypothetical protein
MFMHYIALCTPCIALVNCGHLLHMRVDHAEPELDFQAEEVRWLFGSPQAPCVMEANIVVIKAGPGASHQTPFLLCLKLYL